MFGRILVLLFAIAFNSCGQNKSFLLNAEPVNPGLVYFSENNGHDWTNASAGLPDSLSIGLGGIAVSEKMLGVATKEHGVHIYNQKTKQWQQLPRHPQMIKDNLGALTFYKNGIFVGTQYGGVYYSDDLGKTWNLQNSGLSNKTIRRFMEIKEVLYIATNNGLYSFNNTAKQWVLVYGEASLQVNGLCEFMGDLYMATNRGVYKSNRSDKDWTLILPKHSVHNITADDSRLFAMTYNALLISSMDGVNWQSSQAGLPDNLYTFNIVKKGGRLFAGQWDGVYSKEDPSKPWKSTSNGLPIKFAATNLKIFKDIIVVSSAKSEKK